MTDPPVATTIMKARMLPKRISSGPMLNPLRKLLKTVFETKAENETRKSKTDRARKLILELSEKPILLKTNMFVRLVNTPSSDTEQQKIISLRSKIVSNMAMLMRGAICGQVLVLLLESIAKIRWYFIVHARIK
ncbi:hypothetical protein RRG08_016402 [Elysia crispata]|uniref:Uncharacterized protein n=1 Tax=Elysia crispata TaxID=231223 RepID=A0AAE0Y8Z5_9GAST|nr:hypothetical protein RRG08_016402 [Elysia crispata]